MITGISFGLGAALLISISYIFSRRFTEVKGGAPIQLVHATHLLLTPVAVLIFLLGPRELYPPLASYILPGLGTTVFYLCAQFLMFTALRHTAASRVSPLMGLKLLFLMVLTTLLFSVDYSAFQITAVVLAVAAALILNTSGAPIPLVALLAILGACFCYAVSDIFIGLLVPDFAHLAPLTRGMIPLSVSYTMAGVIMILLTPLLPRQKRSSFTYALPYAASWMGAMVLFFSAVSYVEVMYATIIQSTRGILSVLIGAALGFAGFHLLEERHGWGIILRRTGAAIMMTAAVALFGLGGI